MKLVKEVLEQVKHCATLIKSPDFTWFKTHDLKVI